VKLTTNGAILLSAVGIIVTMAICTAAIVDAIFGAVGIIDHELTMLRIELRK
jgi:hypothetical protein